VREPDAATILDFLGRMEFRSLSRKVAQRLGVEAPAIADDSGQMRPTEASAPEEPQLPPIDRSSTRRCARASASTTGSP
jgi:DNA polymerase-1